MKTITFHIEDFTVNATAELDYNETNGDRSVFVDSISIDGSELVDATSLAAAILDLDEETLLDYIADELLEA